MTTADGRNAYEAFQELAGHPRRSRRPVLIGFANSASPAGLVGRRKLMTDQAKNREPKEKPEAPDHPRLTPQGHASGTASGEDSTDPQGGAKEGQSDKAEG